MPSLKERIKAFMNPGERREYSPGMRFSLTDMLEAEFNITPEQAHAFAAVWQAMRIWSELPASLPIEIYEEKGESRIPIEHEIKQVLLYPNSLMNRFTCFEFMNAMLQGWGNGIAIIERKNGRPSGIIPIHTSCVVAKIKDNKLYYDIKDDTLGIKETFFSEEIIHYRGYTMNRFWGRSPLELARDNIGLGLSAEKFGAKFFKKGGNLKAVIETSGHLDDAAFKEWKKRWDTFYSGEAGDHSTPVLEYGMSYKPLGISPEAAQFLQTRQFSIQDVARWFNLPPHMLGDLSRSTFSNIEHQDIQFVKYSFRPAIRRQELELEDKLLLPWEKGKIRIKYSLDGLLRGDLASITNHIREMAQLGIITPDEGRGLLNRNPYPDGSGAQPYRPANITGKEGGKNNNHYKLNMLSTVID